jgi:hypothetical protein
MNRCYSPSVIAVGMARTSLGIFPCLLSFALLLTTAGCGRPATEQDCQLIVDRNVELAMKNLDITDPALIDKRKQQIRTEQQEGIKACIGKNVTDKMMACVKNAQRQEDIDGCFR